MAGTNRHRWIFFTNVLDLEIFDIILSSCKYTVFDKKEIILDMPKKENSKVLDFITNREIESQLANIIKDKKNKYIIYNLAGSDPIDVRNSFEKLVNKISPKSNFLFNLVCRDYKYINHKLFYSVYIIDGDSRLIDHKEQEGNSQE